VTQHLLDQTKHQWSGFLEARKQNHKKLMNDELKKQIFYASSLALGSEEQAQYARALLWLTFEENIPIPIMNPELWKTIFPSLKLGYESNQIIFMKWMYKAFSFQGVYEYLKPIDQDDILRLILTIEPGNKQVMEWLYIDLLSTLDFYLHEIPIGLLADKQVCLDTVVEAEELEEAYSGLRNLKSRFCSLDYYKKRLNEWIAYKESGTTVSFWDWTKR
jgi:hypothetical protein